MKIIRTIESNTNHYLKEVSIESPDSFDNDYIKTVIFVDSKSEHQSIEGFGASFTESSAYLVNEVLSAEDKSNAMDLLFSPDKLNMTFMRNTIGASDYALGIYNYMESENSKFSLDRDKKSIIPLTKEALEINKELTIMSSPWSAPGWMKTSGSMIGGTLKTDKYEAYAKYFVDYIKAMNAENIDIKYITVQNEPMFVPQNYPGMYMNAEMQNDFILNYLRPQFKENNIETKIVGYDHNWDRIAYPLELISKDSVDGIAWHWYGGNVKSQSIVHKINPNLEVFFTEGSGGEWIPDFLPAFSNLMRTGIEILRNQSRSMILWNIALDEKNGPTVPGFGKSTCRGLLKVNSVTQTFEPTVDFFGLYHFSHYVPKGSKVIDSESNDNLRSVAFKRPDKKLVIVLFNPDDDLKNVEMFVDSQSFSLNINGQSAYTILLEGV